MTILLPTLAGAFSALCVWLAVRIVNRRERWAKWTLAGVVGLPVLYVASFGPAIYIHYMYSPEQEFFYQAYAPILGLVDNPEAPLYGTWTANLIWCYVEFWRPYDSGYRWR